MKRFVIFLLPVLFACGNASTDKPVTTDTTKTKEVSKADTVNTVDTISWIDDFRRFRDAVYQKQKPVVKSYFSFPVQEEHNEIWYLIEGDNVNGKKIFTEKDFDAHFDKIFPPAFIKTLLKIKSPDLLAKGEAESPEIKEGDSLRYHMFTSFDKKEKLLSFNLGFKTYEPSIEEWVEHNAIYFFVVTPQGRLRFQKVMMAG